MADSSRKPDSRFIIGFIFILIGAYLLLYNLDLLPFDLPDYILSWKTLLITIGLLIVGTRENKGGGITLIVVGGVFLTADVLDVTLGELIREVWMFWPVVFIVIGLALILRRSREKKLKTPKVSGPMSRLKIILKHRQFWEVATGLPIPVISRGLS